LAALKTSAVPNAVLRLQPGLRYFVAPWPVDELMTLFLTERAPNEFVLNPAQIRLQIRGARGEFRIERLSEGMFVFRSKIAEGASIGAAAEQALDTDPSFDAAHALSALVAEGLRIGGNKSTRADPWALSD